MVHPNIFVKDLVMWGKARLAQILQIIRMNYKQMMPLGGKGTYDKLNIHDATM